MLIYLTKKNINSIRSRGHHLFRIFVRMDIFNIVIFDLRNYYTPQESVVKKIYDNDFVQPKKEQTLCFEYEDKI